MEERLKDLEKFKLYTAKEVASVLGVTDQTIKIYIRAGKLKAQKIGGKWKITEDNLKAFIEGN